MRRSNGTVLHGQLPGFLGAKHNSFVVDQPLQKQDVKIEAIQPRDGLTSARLSSRLSQDAAGIQSGHGIGGDTRSLRSQ